MINVCFAGITGWTAPPIVAAIDQADDLRLVAGVSRSAAKKSLAGAVGSSSDGSVYASVGEALQSTMAVEHLDHWEIIDYASDTKPDVPSGTSRNSPRPLVPSARPSRPFR